MTGPEDTHMTTIAIQFAASGLSWATVPDPLDLDGGNTIRNHVIPWPVLRDYPGGIIPHDMAERLKTFGIVASLVEDSDRVLIAVEPDTDGRRVGIAETVLEAIGCHVEEVRPQDNGAAGIIWELVEDLIAETPRPPGM